MMKATRPLLLATAAALLALHLGACSNDKPDPAPIDNQSEVEEEHAVAPVEPEPAPVAAPTLIEQPTTDANASADIDPEPATSPDEQMLDDASATGMTARTTRDRPSDDAPANDEIEQK